jgi:hypothetical protein
VGPELTTPGLPDDGSAFGTEVGTELGLEFGFKFEGLDDKLPLGPNDETSFSPELGADVGLYDRKQEVKLWSLGKGRLSSDLVLERGVCYVIKLIFYDSRLVQRTDITMNDVFNAANGKGWVLY